MIEPVCSGNFGNRIDPNFRPIMLSDVGNESGYTEGDLVDEM
ncbi:hypothetical protein ACIQXV_12060 [Neobacillus sp. NPDC097160]